MTADAKPRSENAHYQPWGLGIITASDIVNELVAAQKQRRFVEVEGRESCTVYPNILKPRCFHHRVEAVCPKVLAMSGMSVKRRLWATRDRDNCGSSGR